ncbi:hypothetical protein K504DRAFT_460994 [Pleomassaria siparia CBS 279.74]|uniref:Carbohydrate-binding module family 19 domain-containing protein n=1 Tax=Pleomassaria siparia CBS 279.74 TaxID=1314801 RepID=A0A6G1JWT2_9PLEO|nr:hypothetical protein K504DRAFT_460994 [Pleomassaria siparia CBS 279.74]
MRLIALTTLTLASLTLAKPITDLGLTGSCAQYGDLCASDGKQSCHKETKKFSICRFTGGGQCRIVQKDEACEWKNSNAKRGVTDGVFERRDQPDPAKAPIDGKGPEQPDHAEGPEDPKDPKDPKDDEDSEDYEDTKDHQDAGDHDGPEEHEGPEDDDDFEDPEEKDGENDDEE